MNTARKNLRLYRRRLSRYAIRSRSVSRPSTVRLAQAIFDGLAAGAELVNEIGVDKIAATIAAEPMSTPESEAE